MSLQVQLAKYFNASMNDETGQAYNLAHLAGMGVNLLAFSAVPNGPGRTQLTLFPNDPGAFAPACEKAGLQLDGPHQALLVQGDDEPGILAEIHTKLQQADVRFYAASGVASGDGRFGYVIYFREEDCPRALSALHE